MLPSEAKYTYITLLILTHENWKKSNLPTMF